MNRQVSKLLKHYNNYGYASSTVDGDDQATKEILREFRGSRNAYENPIYQGGTPRGIRKAIKRGIYPHFTGVLPEKHALRVTATGMFVIPIKDLRTAYERSNPPVRESKVKFYMVNRSRKIMIKLGQFFQKPSLDFESVEVGSKPSLRVKKSWSTVGVHITMGYRWRKASELHTKDWIIADVLESSQIDDIEVHKVLAWQSKSIRLLEKYKDWQTFEPVVRYAAKKNDIISVATTANRAIGGFTARVKSTIGNELWDL